MKERHATWQSFSFGVIRVSVSTGNRKSGKRKECKTDIDKTSSKMQQEQKSPELCIKGCGFFGAAASGGMCSVCWKKEISNRQVDTFSRRSSVENSEKKEEVIVSMTAVVENTTENAVSSMELVGGTKEEGVCEATEKKEENLIQKNKNRCWECKKKVGLTAIECRCRYVFCGLHRYADQHSCTFDFKAADRAELAKKNPGGGHFEKLQKL